jgi:hypothetical protein
MTKNSRMKIIKIINISTQTNSLTRNQEETIIGTKKP